MTANSFVESKKWNNIEKNYVNQKEIKREENQKIKVED